MAAAATSGRRNCFSETDARKRAQLAANRADLREPASHTCCVCTCASRARTAVVSAGLQTATVLSMTVSTRTCGTLALPPHACKQRGPACTLCGAGLRADRINQHPPTLPESRHGPRICPGRPRAAVQAEESRALDGKLFAEPHIISRPSFFQDRRWLETSAVPCMPPHRSARPSSLTILKVVASATSAALGGGCHISSTRWRRVRRQHHSVSSR